MTWFVSKYMLYRMYVYIYIYVDACVIDSVPQYIYYLFVEGCCSVSASRRAAMQHRCVWVVVAPRLHDPNSEYRFQRSVVESFTRVWTSYRTGFQVGDPFFGFLFHGDGITDAVWLCGC